MPSREPSFSDEQMTRLSTEFRLEVEELKKLQRTNEEARKAAAKKKEDEQRELVNELLRGQAEQLREKQELRRWIQTRVLIPVSTLLLGGGGTLGYVRYTTEPEKATAKVEDIQREVAEETENLEDNLEDKIQTLEKRLERNDKRQERLVGIQMDQQVELSASIQFLATKIDVISPKAASVDVPDAVTDGQTKAERILESREGDVKYDPAAPFADLE